MIQTHPVKPSLLIVCTCVYCVGETTWLQAGMFCEMSAFECAQAGMFCKMSAFECAHAGMFCEMSAFECAQAGIN